MGMEDTESASTATERLHDISLPAHMPPNETPSGDSPEQKPLSRHARKKMEVIMAQAAKWIELILGVMREGEDPHTVTLEDFIARCEGRAQKVQRMCRISRHS